MPYIEKIVTAGRTIEITVTGYIPRDASDKRNRKRQQNHRKRLMSEKR